MVDDAGVDLRRGEFGVAEHFADGFDGYSVSVSNCRRECVASKVRGYAFLDARCGCDLFEVEVVLGIAQHGQEIAVDARRFVLFRIESGISSSLTFDATPVLTRCVSIHIEPSSARTRFCSVNDAVVE